MNGLTAEVVKAIIDMFVRMTIRIFIVKRLDVDGRPRLCRWCRAKKGGRPLILHRTRLCAESKG